MNTDPSAVRLKRPDVGPPARPSGGAAAFTKTNTGPPQMGEKKEGERRRWRRRRGVLEN